MTADRERSGTEYGSAKPLHSDRRVSIAAGRGTFWRNLREVVGSSELVAFFAWRDIKVRYTQTGLGVLWAVAQPVLLVAVFSAFFGRIVRLDESDLSYPVFALAGLVPWTFFVNAVSGAANSVVLAANMVTKVYFPRMTLPLAAVVSWVPDLLVTSVVMIIGVGVLGAPLGLRVLWLPLAVSMAVPAAVSASLGLAAVNVAYRDVRYALPFVLQIWLFITPVIYSVESVPSWLRPLSALNPMVGVVESVRWTLSDTQVLPAASILISAVGMSAMLLCGAYVFHRFEPAFADVV